MSSGLKFSSVAERLYEISGIKRLYSDTTDTKKWVSATVKEISVRDYYFVKGGVYSSKQKAKNKSDDFGRDTCYYTDFHFSCAIVLEDAFGDEVIVSQEALPAKETPSFLYGLLVGHNWTECKETVSVEYKLLEHDNDWLLASVECGNQEYTSKLPVLESISDSYSTDSTKLEKTTNLCRYTYENLRKDSPWIECDVVDCTESGNSLLLVTETPIGGEASFEFEFTKKRTTPYWKLVESYPGEYPTNSPDCLSPVYLQHRGYRYHDRTEYRGIETTGEVIRSQSNSVVAVDEFDVWELRLDPPTGLTDFPAVSSRVPSKLNISNLLP